MNVVVVVMLDSNNSHRMNSNVTSSSSSSSAKSNSVLFLNYGPAMTVFVAAFLGLFVVATVFGNFLVVLSLYRFRFLRTVSNYLIGNLALSDFLLAVAVLPLSSVNESLGHWIFGRTLCGLWLVADVLCCTASIWNLCAIAFDRFTATLCPVWYRDRRSSKQVVVYVAVVWLISATVCLPPVLGWNDLTDTYVFDNATGVYHCVLFQTPSYVVYSANGSFFLPFVVTLALYVAIFATLRLKVHRMRRADSARSLRQRTASLCPAGDPISERLLLDPKISRPDSKAVGASSANADMGLFVEAEEKEETAVLCPPPPPPPLLKTVVFSRRQSRRRQSMVDTGSSSPGRSDQHQYQPCSLDPLSPPPPAADVDDQRSRDAARTTMTPLEAFGPSPREELPSSSSSPVVACLLPASTQPRAVKAPSERRFSSTQRYEQREMRATVRMAIIIGAFCGMWLGFFLLYTIRGCCPDCSVPRKLNAVFFWLGYSNSSVNPILYTIFNDEFKRAFSSILHRPKDSSSSRNYGKQSSTQRRSILSSTINPRWRS